MPKRRGETSYKETAFGIIPRSKLVIFEIQGIKKAWDLVLKNHNKGIISITPHFLCEVHKVGFGWIFPGIAGKFRNREVTVSKHKPPKSYMIPQLMKDFTEDLKIRLKKLPRLGQADTLDELIDLLTWSHHRFLSIHPFFDYNGRIARLITNMILLNLSLPPVELRVETKSGRKRYIDALEAADAGDYSLLKKLMKDALEEATKALS